MTGQATLRRAQPADQPFLQALFLDSRPDFAQLPPAMAGDLIRLQIAAQHTGYLTSFPAAVDHVIELGTDSAAVPVGRCWTHLSETELRLLDLAVCERMRGQGIGSSVLGELCTMAERAGVPLRLSVWQANEAAVRLYRRLGFLEDGTDGGHLRMLWTAPKAASGSADADNARGATDE